MGYINATTYPSFGRSLRLYWEERNVNTEANTSDIYWELQGYNRVADSTGYYDAGPFNVTINGVKVANNIYPSGARIQLREDTVVARGTLANIAHNADGSKSVTASFSCDYIYDGTNTAAGSGSITLTTIPRASTVTVPDGIFGQSWTFTIAAASSSFTHDITVAIGTHTVSYADQAAGGFIVTSGVTQGWADAAASSTSATVTVTVVTKSGDTTIGTTTETATFYVPDSWAPSAVQPTLVNVVDGYNSTAIQNVSKASIRVRYQAGRGATLTSLKVYGPGVNTTVNNPTANETVTTGTLTRSGTNTWTVTVTDSRGRQTTQTVTLNVTAYRLPTVKLTVHRCDSDGTANDLGNYMTATAVCTMDTSISGNKGQVAATLTNSGGTVTSLGSLTNQSTATFTLTTSPVAAASTATFLVTATVKDSVLNAAGQSVVVTTRLSTAQVLIDFKPTGDGIAFGGSSTESQVVAVKNWDLHLDNPLAIAYGGTGATGISTTTWSSDMTVAYSDGSTLTWSNPAARMDRLGPIAHIYGYFRITALGTTGNKNLVIGGLPVTIKVPLSGTGTPFYMQSAPSDGIPLIVQVTTGGQSLTVIRGPQAASAGSRPSLVAGWCSFDLWAFVA